MCSAVISVILLTKLVPRVDRTVRESNFKTRKENRKHFMTVFAGAIGGLLLLGSIGLAIYVTANGKEVKTWKPLV